mgnify:CR=1 FL=1
MAMTNEEPIGPCTCGGTVCNRGFGWIMGKMSDLAGGFHSSKHNVSVCQLFPEDLMEWDVEDEIFLPPPPPGLGIKTLKRFMLSKGKSGDADDIQNTDASMKKSERMQERMGSEAWREEYS